MFTPSHPPYAYMIRNAIEALGSNSGAKSISEYIKAKFSGLPLAHDQLILFYINQLIESRELAFSGEPDRCFVILESPSPPTLSAKYLSPPEFIVKFAIKSLNEEGGSTQKSICSNILANFGELPWAPRKFLFFFINRLVEKGELGPGAGPGRYVLVPQSLGPKGPVAQEGPNKAEEEGKDVVESSGGGNDSGSGSGGGGGGSDPKPKRGRGRPRKERPNASESSQSDPKPKRGRGRPRLKRPNASESSQSDPKPKRGRGRPPQKRPNASESSQSGMAQEAQDAPRPTQPVRPPPQLNLGPNEYILALPAVAAATVEVNPPGSSSVPAKS